MIRLPQLEPAEWREHVEFLCGIAIWCGIVYGVIRLVHAVWRMWQG